MDEGKGPRRELDDKFKETSDVNCPNRFGRVLTEECNAPFRFNSVRMFEESQRIPGHVEQMSVEEASARLEQFHRSEGNDSLNKQSELKSGELSVGEEVG